MGGGNGHLLRVGRFMIARRYSYAWDNFLGAGL
jgi:hypothetical protein